MRDDTATELAHPPHIRWMLRRDTEEVLEIARQSLEAPLTEAELLSLLRSTNVIVMIAEVSDLVVGFMIYELRTAMLVIDSLCVLRDARRLGVGRAMIEKLRTKLSPMRRRWLRASVEEEDIGAQLFLKACGFEAIGITMIPAAGETWYEFQIECGGLE